VPYGQLFEVLIFKIIIMKSTALSTCRLALTSLFLLALNLFAFAQDKIEIDKQEVGNWFQRNWIWVAAGAVVLVLIIALSGRSKTQRKITTVTKDDMGNVKRVVTTEERS